MTMSFSEVECVAMSDGVQVAVSVQKHGTH